MTLIAENATKIASVENLLGMATATVRVYKKCGRQRAECLSAEAGDLCQHQCGDDHEKRDRCQLHGCADVGGDGAHVDRTTGWQRSLHFTEYEDPNQKRQSATDN